MRALRVLLARASLDAADLGNVPQRDAQAFHQAFPGAHGANGWVFVPPDGLESELRSERVGGREDQLLGVGDRAVEVEQHEALPQGRLAHGAAVGATGSRRSRSVRLIAASP
jgi:hypothetical protein